MLRSTRSWSSFFGLVLAGAASMATSQPAPDWTRDDTLTGVVTLLPEQDEVFLRVKATSRVESSLLSVALRVHGAPEHEGADATTPIILFFGPPAEDGADAGAPYDVRMAPVPGSAPTAEGGFERALTTNVPAGTEGRVYAFRIAWTSPSPSDGLARVTSSSSSASVTTATPRPLAPRKPTTLQWRAQLATSGYDDPPPDLVVDLEAVP